MTLKRLSLVALFSLSVVGCTTAPNTLAINTTQKIVNYERSKSDLAVKAFMHLVVDGIKKYKSEIKVDAVLSMEEKEWIAKDLLNTYTEHIDEVV